MRFFLFLLLFLGSFSMNVVAASSKDSPQQEKKNTVFEDEEKTPQTLTFSAQQLKQIELNQKVKVKKDFFPFLFFSEKKKENRHSRLKKLILKQIRKDKVPIPDRLGGVFVPRIVFSKNVDPIYFVVYDKSGKQTGFARTGKKIFLVPGDYKVRVGTSDTNVLPYYKIKVTVGKLVVIYPTWAALIVRVTDDRQIGFRGTYELINLDTKKGVGTGIGADDTFGDKIRPWLLPDGLYMLVRVGDNYLARTNFLTVRIISGEVTTFRLVLDKNTSSFLGGGIQIPSKKLEKEGAWRWNIQLSGNFIWGQQQNVPSTPTGHSLSLTAFIYARVTMDLDKHYFLSTLDTELGITTFIQTGDTNVLSFNYRKGTDRFNLQAIYIYRLLRLLGPYARFAMQTNFLSNTYNFSETDPRILNASSIYHCLATDSQRQCSLNSTMGPGELKSVQLSDPFDPIELKQGLGINLQAVKRSWLDLRVLFGLGFRQNINFRSFQFNSSTDVSTTRCKDANQRNANDPLSLSNCPKSEDQEKHTSVLLTSKDSSNREGLELALVATGRVGRFMSYTMEFDALSQFGDFLNFDVDLRANFTFRISQFASMIYRLRVRRDPSLHSISGLSELEKWYFEQSVVLNLTLTL